MGNKTQTVKQRIHPLLQRSGGSVIDRAQGLFDRQDPLPSLYTGMSGQREQGLGMQQQRAMFGGGFGVADATAGQFAATQRGAFLGANPWLDQVVNRSVMAARPGVDSAFAGAGRYGSGLQQQAWQDVAQSTAANLYGQNYQQERNRMVQSLAAAPMAEQMQYADAQRLKDVGLEYEQDALARQQEATRQYMFPYQQVAMMNAALTGNPLMAHTKTQTATPFDWMGMIGGLLSPSIPGMGGGK